MSIISIKRNSKMITEKNQLGGNLRPTSLTLYIHLKITNLVDEKTPWRKKNKGQSEPTNIQARSE